MPMMRVLVDANVLYSRTLRDWLALLFLEPKTTPLFQVYWTEDILNEACYHLRRRYPKAPGHLIPALRKKITEVYSLGRVEEFLVDDSFPCTDENDQHVHAAAIACGAHLLPTMDRGFARVSGDTALPYQIAHPDSFFVQINALSPQTVRSVTRKQQRYRQQRNQKSDLVQALIRTGCPHFAAQVREHLRYLDAEG